MKRILLLLIAVAPLLAGCVAAIGNGGQRSNATLGQQLIDLQKAKDAGAISDPEYQKQRSRLLGEK